MKALSLWQPWASLMAVGIKRNETRSWSTAYRGELAICAAKRKMGKDENEMLICCPLLMEALINTPPHYGVVIAVVTLQDCIPTEEINLNELTSAEYDAGNYEPRRFVWITDSLCRLREPIPVIGRQSLFDLPPDVEAKVMAQLKTLTPIPL